MRKKRKTTKKFEPKTSNKGKTWSWSNNPHGTIKTGDRWTLLAVECYIRKECQGCIYWRYCKQNSYEDYPIMRQVVRELFRTLGEPPERFLDLAYYYYYNENAGGKQGYD